MALRPVSRFIFSFAALWVFYTGTGVYGQNLSPESTPNLTQPDFPQEKLSVSERPHPEYDEVGYRYASYIIKPTISLLETFDSNILGSSAFERSDFFTSAKPTLSIDSDWRTNAVSFYAEGDIAKYARYTSENVDNFLIRGDGRLDIEREQTLTLDASYQVGHESRYSPESQAAVSLAGGGTYALHPTQFALSTVQLTYVYSPSRLGFEIAASVNDYAFTNERTLNGGLAINGDRNRREFVVTPRASYELTPGYQVFVEGWGNRREYDSTFDATPGRFKRSSTGYAIAAGGQVKIGDVVTGELYVGYQDQMYDDERLAPNAGVYLGGSVLWNITPLTSLKLAVTRSVQETILLGSSGLWDTEINATAEHELLRNIILTAEAGFSLNDYQGISRNDTTVTGALGARWKFTQTYSVGVSGAIQHRSSNLSVNGFTRALIAVDVRAAF
jgi:hypothetical protein